MKKWITAMVTVFSGIVLVMMTSSCAGTSADSSTSNKSDKVNEVDYRHSKADVVVLSFFDMYCPHCQKNAKHVNELHAMTQRRSSAQKVDFYAIGWNNTPLEAEMYRKRYHVTYPVVSDRDRSISSRFGKFKPPLLIALKKQGGQWTEFYRVVNIRGDNEKVLHQITH
jgi:peroxiredoxin